VGDGEKVDLALAHSSRAWLHYLVAQFVEDEQDVTLLLDDLAHIRLRLDGVDVGLEPAYDHLLRALSEAQFLWGLYQRGKGLLRPYLICKII